MKPQMKLKKFKNTRQRKKLNFSNLLKKLLHDNYKRLSRFFNFIIIYLGLKEPFSKLRKTSKIKAKDSATDEQQRRYKIAKAQADKNLKKKTLF